MKISRTLQLVLLMLSASVAHGEDAPLRQPANFDITVGATLYQDHCAVCHGVDLEGQPDWRIPGANGQLPAPPHDETGHTWHHGDALLFNYTRLGGQAALAQSGVEGFPSGMPAFQDMLSDQEIWNIIAFIKSTWPQRLQEIQSARTR